MNVKQGQKRRAEPIKQTVGFRNVSSEWNLDLQSFLRRNSEFKQQRRRRLRKSHLKSEFALLQTLLRLFHLVEFVKSWQFFWS